MLMGDWDEGGQTRTVKVIEDANVPWVLAGVITAWETKSERVKQREGYVREGFGYVDWEMKLKEVAG